MRQSIKKISRAGTAGIKARGDAAHGVKSRDSASDAASDTSLNLEKFLSSLVFEAKGSLDLWYFTDNYQYYVNMTLTRVLYNTRLGLDILV